MRPAAQPPKTQTGRRAAAGVEAAGFVAECWAELKKADWPSQRQVMTGTVAVIIACAIVGTYLWVSDLAIQPFVERLLLGR